tara:strand:- start:1879 stop:3699 length:1821 start_codon:yes stop_codon:yes gene_type:complete
MIQFEKVYRHLKKIKLFEKEISKHRILTFTVTPHWHNFLLLISGIVSARGLKIDYYWNDFYTHDNKDTKDDQKQISTFFKNIDRKKLNKNLNFFNIKQVKKTKLSLKLLNIIKKQSEIDASNHLRKINLDKKSQRYKEIYLNKLNQNINLSSKIVSVVKRYKYSSAIVPAGSFLYEWGVVFKTLRYLNIDCCSIDYNIFGASDKQLSVSWNYSSVIKDDFQFREFKKYFKTLSIQKKNEIIKSTNKINKTFKSSYASYWQNKKYNTVPGTQIVNQEKNIQSLLKKLDINKNDKIILLLPSHGYEQHFRMKNLIFKNYIEWLNLTINKLIVRKNIKIIVRCHPFPYNPNKDVINYQSSDETSLSVLKKNKFYNHENLKIIGPFDKINTYDLLKLADLGIVYTSLTGLEMAMIGKKPIVCTNTSYSDEKYICKPKNKKEYFSNIETLLKKNNTISKNNILRAKVFYYYFTNILPKTFPWSFIKNGFYYNQFNLVKALSYKNLFSSYIDTFDSFIFSNKIEKEKFKINNYNNYLTLINQLFYKKKIAILKNYIFKDYENINYEFIQEKYPKFFKIIQKNSPKIENIYKKIHFNKKKKKSTFIGKIFKYF